MTYRLYGMIQPGVFPKYLRLQRREIRMAVVRVLKIIQRRHDVRLWHGSRVADVDPN